MSELRKQCDLLKKNVLVVILGLALAVPFASLVGCGGSSEAVKPEQFAPKPPAEELSEGGGKRAKTVVPAESD